MDIKALRRDKEKVFDAILVTPDGKMIAKKTMEVYFPVAYEEKHLATIASDVYVVGLFAFVVDGYYATVNILSKIRLYPTEIDRVNIEDTPYHVLRFEKGATIVENMNLVKDNTIGYYVYNYIIAQGKVPWYLSALDLMNLFHTSAKYSGVVYGTNHMATELIAAMVMRSSSDINTYWRQEVNSIDDVLKNPPTFIPLRNVMFGARNTTAKLMGAYLNEGMKSAIMYPSETTESVEELLRQ